MDEFVLWKGEFNWYGQCFTLYTNVQKGSGKDPFVNFCHQLSKKVERTTRAVRDYFLDNTRDGYRIMKVNKERRKE